MRAAFEPRVKRCILCPKLVEKDRYGASVGNLFCSEHNWLIKREVAKVDAVCSTNTKASDWGVSL